MGGCLDRFKGLRTFLCRSSILVWEIGKCCRCFWFIFWINKNNFYFLYVLVYFLEKSVKLYIYIPNILFLILTFYPFYLVDTVFESWITIQWMRKMYDRRVGLNERGVFWFYKKKNFPLFLNIWMFPVDFNPSRSLLTFCIQSTVIARVILIIIAFAMQGVGRDRWR